MSKTTVKAKKHQKQVLRYYGSKQRIGKWIASFHPPHYCYVSVCGGGASDLFTKPPSKFEVYNDLDQNVVNFFKVFRDRRDELIDAIRWTPFSRAEFELANETFPESGCIDPDSLSELERARRFYIICQQGRSSGSSVWKVTWRRSTGQAYKRSKTTVQEWNEVDHLYQAADRLKSVQIDKAHALDIIDLYDDKKALFYLDPPYFHGTRKHWLKAYRFEWTEEDHIRMADRLQTIKGMAIISGYPSELYEELYTRRGWQIETIKARDNNNRKKIEAIWISPNAQKHRQGTFLEGVA